MTTDPAAWTLAAGLLLGWMGASAWWLRPARRASLVTDGTLVLTASQTGQALELGQQCHSRLLASGEKVTIMPLGQVMTEQLRACDRLLVIASTTGLGEAPDEARAFTALMQSTPDLSSTDYAVLALGDRKYADFCAFGRQVDRWLQDCGARPLHNCIEVDDLDHDSLARWEALLGTLGAAQEQGPQPARHQSWRVVSREHLNPTERTDIDAPALWRVRLEPEQGTLPSWIAGDLFEIRTPTGHVREYSIASLPDEGHVLLLVRAVFDEAGRPGEGSGLLCAGIPVGGTLPARLREHTAFHAPTGQGPLLLIAAGSGLGGIRPHALQAMRANRPLWLILGERHPDIDAAVLAEAKAWQAQGRIFRLDLAFSRPATGQGQYVQDILSAHADALHSFLGNRGAILLCGGLAMGKAAEAALQHAMGAPWWTAARAQNRFHADLY